MAEFLIKARDPVDLPKDAEKRSRCYRRGDVVVVMPDGHKWGKDEGLPKFVLVKIPGMPAEKARDYISSHYRDTGLLDSKGRPVLKLVTRRKWKVLIDDANFPTKVRNTLANTGSVTVSWEDVKSYIYDKISMVTT